MSETTAKAADLMRARAEQQQMIKLMACLMWKLRGKIGADLSVPVAAADIRDFVDSFTFQKPGVNIRDDGAHGVVIELVDMQSGNKLMLPQGQGVLDDTEADADRWQTLCRMLTEDKIWVALDDNEVEHGCDSAQLVQAVDKERADCDAAALKPKLEVVK